MQHFNFKIVVRARDLGLLHLSTNVERLLKAYSDAFLKYGMACRAAPDQWTKPDVKEFERLLGEMLPLGDAGNIHCQNAIATIFCWGLIMESEEDFVSLRKNLVMEASYWWSEAARRGHPYALDNLLNNGLGIEKTKLEKMVAEVQKSHPKLKPSAPEFLGVLYHKISGKAFSKEWAKISPGVAG